MRSHSQDWFILVSPIHSFHAKDVADPMENTYIWERLWLSKYKLQRTAKSMTLAHMSYFI